VENAKRRRARGSARRRDVRRELATLGATRAKVSLSPGEEERGRGRRAEREALPGLGGSCSSRLEKSTCDVDSSKRVLDALFDDKLHTMTNASSIASRRNALRAAIEFAPEGVFSTRNLDSRARAREIEKKKYVIEVGNEEDGK
jgi:hypothetical protein